MAIVKLNKICKSFTLKDMSVKALDNVDLSVEAGEMLAITGASGSGKTTMLNIVGLLDNRDSGELELFGEPIDFTRDSVNARIRNTRIGFVFQDYSLMANENAIFNVMLPLYFTKMSLSKMRKAALAESSTKPPRTILTAIAEQRFRSGLTPRKNAGRFSKRRRKKA